MSGLPCVGALSLMLYLLFLDYYCKPYHATLGSRSIKTGGTAADNRSPLSLGTTGAATGVSSPSAALSLACRLAYSGQSRGVGGWWEGENAATAPGRLLSPTPSSPPKKMLESIVKLWRSRACIVLLLPLSLSPISQPAFGPFLPASAVVAGWLARGLCFVSAGRRQDQHGTKTKR
ncbi:hypothetical protein B0J12DRAFT_331103 [Macrophomina phaseolina]|uniref:Uncharacterized protein n=1 Tax=Macrophomina phaseolina TaxID=35725 RepID=A0ABQ8GL75_9PEZI|nr:hypothetical protein B0J12DRAFT_331103 [Macrophomina phaseolina]